MNKDGMTEDVIKPCPFCGSDKVRLTTGVIELWVTCDKCAADGPMKSSGYKAIEKWNGAKR